MSKRFHCTSIGQYVFFEPPKVIFNKESRLWRRFLRFHNRHPHVYENLRAQLLRKLQEGQKFSARLVVESIRWDPASYPGSLNFNIDNNFIPYYKRIFVEEFPEYFEAFELRPVKAD